jgi:hypothetical protein
MNPDVARQLAADRHADLRREAEAQPAPRRATRRWRLTRGALARYAGAPAGTRSGT